MKIEIEIPDWAERKHIVILAGQECVAMKHPEEDHWKVKDIRCNQCGECCLDNPLTPFGVDVEGKCKKLIFDRGKCYCGAKSLKPYTCMIDSQIAYDACCIKHREVKA